MCEPTTIAMLAITAVSAVAGVSQQRQAAKGQESAVKQQQALQQNDLARQRAQQQAAAAAQMNEQARSAMKDMALFDVVAGEFGGGNSVDRARAVSEVQSGERLATIAANEENAQDQLSFQSLATQMQANSKLASIQQPSYIGAALQIGAAGVNAYQAGAFNRAGPNTTDYRGTTLPNSLRGGQ